jgi:UDP-N-acetyl-D-mannosaminouronate:lipid I N-acetyl-D-mannosaminouronosyltransferase
METKGNDYYSGTKEIDTSVFINGIKVYPYPSIQSLLTYIEEYKGILIAINAEKILHSVEETRNIINNNIGYCDGIGAVMALKRKGYKNIIKISGCELWLDIIKRYHTTKTFYLLGSEQDIIEKTALKLKQQYRDIRIVGFHNGFIKSNEEYNSIIANIQNKKPDVIFVAMGSPKQEYLMAEMYEKYPALYQGLGGSFDVYAGKLKRAPNWMIRYNLEGVYRVLKQPRRLNRLIRLLPFWINLLFNKY